MRLLSNTHQNLLELAVQFYDLVMDLVTLEKTYVLNTRTQPPSFESFWSDFVMKVTGIELKQYETLPERSITNMAHIYLYTLNDRAGTPSLNNFRTVLFTFW